MRQLLTISIALVITLGAWGQSADSVSLTKTFSRFTHSSDSLVRQIDSLDVINLDKVDSIQSTFKIKTDSLKRIYQQPLNEIEQAKSSAQHKVDSLTSLQLPTGRLTKKMDSLTALQNQKLAEHNQKVDQLKSKATSGLNEITLPPQMQEPLDKATQSIKSYVPTLPNGKLQEFELPSGKLLSGKDFKLPEVKNLGEFGKNIPKSDELNKITGELGKVKGVTTEVTDLAQDAQSIANGKLNEVKQIDKTLEKQVLKIDEVQEFQKLTSAINPLEGTGLTGTDPEALKKQAAELAKKEAMEMVKTEATNHFAGKEELLQKSMDKMTKLKGKYSDVKSMAELPKKLPNPLHDTPFIERVVPGISFQIQKDDYFLLDVNISASYSITPRFSAGAGWVQRLAFDKVKFQPNMERVYGPRAILQFLWTKGINFRFLPELLNTDVPPQLVTNPSDNGNREWVWSAFAGIKKDFTIFKSIKGNTEALYNLYDPGNKSPYQDRFSLRFGFEFSMKKKLRKA